MSDFSIVTATFNAGGSIRRCLQSVRENRLAETEHLVIDNQSSDDTLEKVRAFGNVRVISEKDNGIYEAMNKGIRSAGNELTAGLNADDASQTGTLEAVKERFESVPESDIVYGNILVNGREVKPPEGIASFGGARIFHPAAFIRRSLFERIGYFDESFRICADLDFFLRAKESGAVFTYLDRPLTDFALGGLSTVRRKQTAAELRHILIRHGYPHLFAYSYYCAMRLRAKISQFSACFRKGAS